jgi:hypothetical protein
LTNRLSFGIRKNKVEEEYLEEAKGKRRRRKMK